MKRVALLPPGPPIHLPKLCHLGGKTDRADSGVCGARGRSRAATGGEAVGRRVVLPEWCGRVVNLPSGGSDKAFFSALRGCALEYPRHPTEPRRFVPVLSENDAPSCRNLCGQQGRNYAAIRLPPKKTFSEGGGGCGGRRKALLTKRVSAFTRSTPLRTKGCLAHCQDLASGWCFGVEASSYRQLPRGRGFAKVRGANAEEGSRGLFRF